MSASVRATSQTRTSSISPSKGFTPSIRLPITNAPAPVFTAVERLPEASWTPSIYILCFLFVDEGSYTAAMWCQTESLTADVPLSPLPPTSTRTELAHNRFKVYLAPVEKLPMSITTFCLPPLAPGTQLALVRTHASTVRGLLPTILPPDVLI